MQPNQPITLHDYYRAFGSLSGLLAGVFAAFPLISHFLFPESIAAYGFPPLGNIEALARIGVVVFALAATYFAFFARSPRPSGNRARVSASIGIAVFFFLLYTGLFMRFVRTIGVPSSGTQVQVSIGFTRTDFAEVNFNGISDWEMLRDRGPEEEQIWKLWTPKSILIARLALYVAYCLSLLSLVAAFSWGVLYQLEETRTKNQP